MLRKFGLDESTIEAEAFRSRADVFAFGEQKMARSKNQKIEQSFPVPRLTITESSDELAALCEQVNDEVEPIGFMSERSAGHPQGLNALAESRTAAGAGLVGGPEPRRANLSHRAVAPR